MMVQWDQVACDVLSVVVLNRRYIVRPRQRVNAAIVTQNVI